MRRRPVLCRPVTGTDAQPMHTDGAYYPRPPRYIAFHSIEPGEASCPTIVSPLDLARLERDRPKILAAPHWVVRGGGHGRFYCSVLECESGQARIRFDPLCMYLASCDARQEAQKLLRNYSGRIEFDWESGRLLIIDNWRCLHAPGGWSRPRRNAAAETLEHWSVGWIGPLSLFTPRPSCTPSERIMSPLIQLYSDAG
jgi:Taurine catabolism dioxygenase TauD, TfdA family